MKDFMKIYVTIKTKADERRWKEFLGKYFPNHYAKRLLEDDLVINYEDYLDGKGYDSKNIAVEMDGYGYISRMLIYYGHYEKVFDFADFRDTLLYKRIVERGVVLERGEPSCINIPVSDDGKLLRKEYIDGKEIYKITFKKGEKHNWINVSSISKEVFYSFIDYLYSIGKDPYSSNRMIVIMPYVSGGAPCGVGIPNLDRTGNVLGVYKDIEDKVPVHKMLDRHFTIQKPDIEYQAKYKTSEWKLEDLKGYENIHFIEDLYEFYISLGIDEEEAYKLCINRYDSDSLKELNLFDKVNDKEKLEGLINWIDDHSPYETFGKINAWPYRSRWMFIYMFRNVFKKFMDENGYKVVVDGGWVLNDKEREMKLGLIDREGNLY